MTEPDPVTQYLALGLALGRHVDGLVDAYYGPPELARRAEEGAPRPPAALADEARALLADLESDRELDATRRHWIAAQVRGLWTTARKLAREPVGYADEVEACYGVRPPMAPQDEFFTTEAANELERTLKELGKDVEVHHYDADHAFFNDTRPEVHDEDDAARAWERTIDFFRSHLG